MDLPILKQVDTLIGLAVVMLLASTVVVAITQFILSSFSRRSRHVSGTVSDLISQIAPKLDQAAARYVAERLLRHPLVGRKRWVAKGGAGSKTGLPLPLVARGEVILRHEIILTLLEWAAGEGPLAQQDRALTAGDPAAKARLAQLTGELRSALQQCGVDDPARALRDVRRNLVEFENANPERAAQLWYTQALVRTGLGDLTGKVFAWYDNSMERVSESFSIEAKVAGSLVGLLLCVATQLDSVSLLRRLSQDDKFRAAVVAKADVAKKAYEEVTNAAPVEERNARRDAADKAVRESMDALRDPKASVIPEYMIWEKVAQAVVHNVDGVNLEKLELRVDDRKFPIPVPTDCASRFPVCPAAQIRAAAPPVDVYADPKSGLTLVARSAAIASIGLFAGANEISRLERVRDWVGFWSRLPGVILSWILLSLGAPFWYDLLKKLLGLRSILQSKDEAERETRRSEQQPAPKLGPPAAATSSAPPLSGEPGGVVLIRDAALRTHPSPQAGVSRQLPGGYLVNVEGFVEAEGARGGAGDRARWYRTAEGDFVWDGDVKAGVAGETVNVKL